MVQLSAAQDAETFQRKQEEATRKDKVAKKQVDLQRMHDLSINNRKWQALAPTFSALAMADASDEGRAFQRMRMGTVLCIQLVGWSALAAHLAAQEYSSLETQIPFEYKVSELLGSLVEHIHESGGDVISIGHGRMVCAFLNETPKSSLAKRVEQQQRAAKSGEAEMAKNRAKAKSSWGTAKNSVLQSVGDSPFSSVLMRVSHGAKAQRSARKVTAATGARASQTALALLAVARDWSESTERPAAAAATPLTLRVGVGVGSVVTTHVSHAHDRRSTFRTCVLSGGAVQQAVTALGAADRFDGRSPAAVAAREARASRVAEADSLKAALKRALADNDFDGAKEATARLAAHEASSPAEDALALPPVVCLSKAAWEAQNHALKGKLFTDRAAD